MKYYNYFVSYIERDCTGNIELTTKYKIKNINDVRMCEDYIINLHKRPCVITNFILLSVTKTKKCEDKEKENETN